MSEELDKELEPKNEEETKEEKPEVKEPEVNEKKEDVESFKKAVAEAEIEKIRKEEKEKLYPSLEKYKADAKAAEEARKLAEEKLKEYEKKNLSADEQANLRLKELEESNQKLQEQIENIVTLANDKINALQLELVKKELLTQYGEEIVPELVMGNTIEELSESAEKAHDRYIAIRDKELSKAKEASKPKEQIGSGIGPSNDKLNVSPTIADIKKVDDPKEWEKMKAKLLSEISKT